MQSLGLNVARGQLRYVMLEGTLSVPKFLSRGMDEHDPAMPLPERMLWYRKAFSTLIDRLQPDRMAYRMHWGGQMKQEQVATFHYPYGVLNLICHERSLDAFETTSIGMTAKRFGLPKGTKPMDVCDSYIGSHPPHWDASQKYAACAAWMILP